MTFSLFAASVPRVSRRGQYDDSRSNFQDLPEGWRTWRFDAIMIIGTGQVSPLVEPYRSYPYVGPENIEADSGAITGLKTSLELGLISGKYLFDADAIVYSKIRPNLNKVCTPGFVGVCSADAYPIWAKKDVVTKGYLAHFMRSNAFVKQAVAASMRSGMPKVNREDIAPIKVLLPPLPEQRRIVEILDQADAGVRTTDALIAAKLNLKRAWAERLLTGQVRFPEFAAEAWQEVTFGSLFQEVERSVIWDDDEHYKLVSVRRRSEGLFFRGKVQGETIKTKTLKYIKANDFLISKMQVVHGAWGLVTPEFDDHHVSASYITLVPKAGREIDMRFFNYLSQLPYVYRLALVSSHGVHIEKMTFNLELLYREKIRIPMSVPEQRKIAEVLSLMDEELGLLRRQLAALKAQKQGLMQKLLTGEVRTRPASETGTGSAGLLLSGSRSD